MDSQILSVRDYTYSITQNTQNSISGGPNMNLLKLAKCKRLLYSLLPP